MPPDHVRDPPAIRPLAPERVAYWYFRLNGFLLLENFILHDVRTGSQRTDIDLLGARFRHRREFGFDSIEPMEDDTNRLKLSEQFDDIVMVEVKTNQPCTLNGPWTKRERQNIHRALAAIGCVPQGDVPSLASRLYRDGSATFGERRIRFVAIGRDHNEGLRDRHECVVQLTWDDVLEFIWRRLTDYHRQKRDVSQWDECGKSLHRLSGEHYENPVKFVHAVKRVIGVQLAATG